MPLLTILGTIHLYIFHEAGERHHNLHVHADYGDFEAEYDIEGNIIEGKMPLPQNRAIRKWIKADREAIIDRWETALRFEHVDKIKGE